MDGTGQWVDNVFIERLWWSLKYEDVYLRSYKTPRDVERGVDEWFCSYNADRPHSTLADATSDEVYLASVKREDEAPHVRRVAHGHATVSEEFKDPFSTTADYGQLAGPMA